MRRAAQAPPPSPAPALFHGLEYIREPKAWRGALKHCDMLGGSLVAITSQERNWEVHGLIEGDTWIGASDVAAEGRWVWPDGSPVALLSLQMEGPSILFSGWEEGKPNNNEDPDLEHDCGQMRLSGRWDDTDCDLEHPFICDMGEPPPTTLDLLTRKQARLAPCALSSLPSPDHAPAPPPSPRPHSSGRDPRRHNLRLPHALRLPLHVLRLPAVRAHSPPLVAVESSALQKSPLCTRRRAQVQPLPREDLARGPAATHPDPRPNPHRRRRPLCARLVSH